MLYFLTRILEPLRQKVGGLRDWAAHTWGSSAADPTPRGWVSWAVTIAWVAVPIVILKVWSDLEETEDAHTGAGKAARAILFGGWLILLALVLPDFKRAPGQYCCAQVGIKDYVGYAMGLLVAASVWQLHTTVHKGIVQMWRYTGGQGTGAAEAPAPGEGA
jgi:hypothetical protein